MSSFFRTLAEKMEDEDTNIADDGLSSGEYSGTIDTGSYILNAALSGSMLGGVPNNKFTGFAGEEATGKTFFILGIIKKFLDDNPTGGVIYYDTESATTKAMMKSRGIDTSRVIISEPETLQKFRHHVLNIIGKYTETPENQRPPMMMALDSLGNISTSKELEDSTAGKDTRDMTRAQLIRATFRVITLKAAKAKIPMLITNHVYAAVGSYIPMNVVSGGGGFKYAASIIAMLSKSKDKDQKTKEVHGVFIKVKVAKSRMSKENKEVTVRLSYDKGLDRWYGLLDLAAKYDIVKKVANKYEFPDGKKYFETYIDEHGEELWTPLLEQLEIAANAEFKYGSDMDFSEPTDSEVEQVLEDA